MGENHDAESALETREGVNIQHNGVDGQVGAREKMKLSAGERTLSVTDKLKETVH